MTPARRSSSMVLGTSLALLVASGLSLAGCSRPTEIDCRKAVENIDRIAGRRSDPAEQAAAVRKCRGSATKKAVACWTAAQTEQDLQACEAPSPKK